MALSMRDAGPDLRARQCTAQIPCFLLSKEIVNLFCHQLYTIPAIKNLTIDVHKATGQVVALTAEIFRRLTGI